MHDFIKSTVWEMELLLKKVWAVNLSVGEWDTGWIKKVIRDCGTNLKKSSTQSGLTKLDWSRWEQTSSEFI